MVSSPQEGQLYISQPVQAKQLPHDFPKSFFSARNPQELQIIISSSDFKIIIFGRKLQKKNVFPAGPEHYNINLR